MSVNFKSPNKVYLLLFVPVYLILFFIIDTLPVAHSIISCAVDAYIPYNRYMIIPYCIWFLWWPCWLLYLMSVSEADFRKLCRTMYTGMAVCLLIQLIWPNGVSIREDLVSTDIFTKGIQLIRSIDPPYCTCPSLLAVISLSIALTVNESAIKDFSATVKSYVWIITMLLIYSAMGIKQQSIINVAAGALLAAGLHYMFRAFDRKHTL